MSYQKFTAGRRRPEHEVPLLTSSLPASLSDALPQVSEQLLTSDAAMGLPDMVEPQGRQVEHLTSPHRAAKGPGLAVTGVPSQIWGQRVQWDPGHLGTQGTGSKPQAL